MIQSLKLQGFKSFLYRELDLNSLTLLTGLNSSGKSSIIQALLILEKAFNNEKSILLTGHGDDRDIKNNSFKGNIELTVEVDGSEFSIEIPFESSTPIKSSFPSIWYISAHRFGPRPSIPIFNESNVKNRIGPNGENVLQCIQYYDTEHPLVLEDLLKHSSSVGSGLTENIKNWLGVISPNIEFKYNVDDRSDTSYSTFDGHRSTNVGFGLSYILPVITTLLVASSNKNNLIIIENPEAHLHPKGQTQLAKLIFLCAKSGTQVIIETHSEHILDGIRLATKEDGNFAANIQIHWFELNKEKNTEVVSPIITDDGRINEWPENFFDQFEVNASKLI